MIDHLTLTVTDFARTRAFYTQALAPLGYSVQLEFEGYLGFGADGRPSFFIKAGPFAQSPMHIAFIAADRERVDAFFAAALAAGGREDGPPGIRAHYHANYYGAFVLDPDGHPIEAVCHLPVGAAPRGSVAARAKKKTSKQKAPAKKKIAARKRGTKNRGTKKPGRTKALGSRR